MYELKDNELVFAKVRPDAIIPTKEEGNAGYDIYANFEEDYMIIPAHSTRLVPTGIASAMTSNWYLQVEERGSTGSKGIKKSAGVVDSNYRGEIFIAVSNVNDKNIVIVKDNIPCNAEYITYPYSKAIAQLVVHEVPKMEVNEIGYEELLEIPSTRGVGALGSSGK